MSNKDLYKKTFSRLHASDTLRWEEMKMKRTGFRCKRKALIFAMIMAAMMAMSVIAYAATGGQIIEDVRVFINGEELDSTVKKIENDGYQIEVTKDEGQIDLAIDEEKDGN